MIYGRAVLERVSAARYRGELIRANAHAAGANPICGDQAELWLDVRDGVIVDAAWKAIGCPPTLAALDVVVEHVRGIQLAAARALDENQIMAALPDLPATSRHAVSLALEVLHDALDAYDIKS